MLRNVNRLICMMAASMVVLAPVPGGAADTARTVKSGKTQVVARIDGREITISNVRTEMARLGLAPGEPGAERRALETLITRHTLVKAAEKAKLHRQPEAVRRINAAREQALADFYLSNISKPIEPTRTEIEDYVAQNSELFHRRREYRFLVLTLNSLNYDIEKVTSSFDKTANFDELAKILDSQKISYTVSETIQFADAFPKAIRAQLAKYVVNDNIVLKSEVQTQIMKIVGVKKAPLKSDDIYRVARARVMHEASQKKAADIVRGLKSRASVEYFHASVAPEKAP